MKKLDVNVGDSEVKEKNLTQYQKRKISLQHSGHKTEPDGNYKATLLEEAASTLPPPLLSINDTQVIGVSDVTVSKLSDASSSLKSKNTYRATIGKEPSEKIVTSRKNATSNVQKRKKSTATTGKKSFPPSSRKVSSASKKVALVEAVPDIQPVSTNLQILSESARRSSNRGRKIEEGTVDEKQEIIRLGNDINDVTDYSMYVFQ